MKGVEMKEYEDGRQKVQQGNCFQENEAVLSLDAKVFEYVLEEVHDVDLHDDCDGYDDDQDESVLQQQLLLPTDVDGPRA